MQCGMVVRRMTSASKAGNKEAGPARRLFLAGASVGVGGCMWALGDSTHHGQDLVAAPGLGSSLRSKMESFEAGIGQRSSALGQLASSGYRFARATYTAACIMMDYKWTLYGLGETPEEMDAFWKAAAGCHKRSAERLYQLCLDLGGTYTKAGQHIASMGHALPPVYIQVMRQLQDRAEQHDFDSVVTLFANEFGVHPDELFADFSREPIASASLAQVHTARVRKTGQKVAVKVQHPFLKERVSADMWTIGALLDAMMWVFPMFNFGWVVPEFEANLRAELDFRIEASNSERVGLSMQRSKRYSVPSVLHEYSSDKVLTMEFVNGCRIDDLDGLRARGIDSRLVAMSMMQLFAKQIFVHGFIHCDPHPGNVLIRIPGEQEGEVKPEDNPQGDFELVLLDHGLYKELDDATRLAYCRLWKSVVYLDNAQMEAQCKALGVEEWRLFSVMLVLPTIQTSNMTKSVKLPMSSTELRSMGKGDWVELTAKISEILAALPEQVKLLMKVNNLLRGLNRDLADNRIDLFHLMCRYSIWGEYCRRDSDGRKPGIVLRLRMKGEMWGLMSHISWMAWKFAFWRWVLAVWGWWNGEEVTMQMLLGTEWDWSRFDRRTKRQREAALGAG